MLEWAENGQTLAHLVEVLSPSVVRVLATPGLDQVIAREIVIYDVAEPPSLRSGDVLLGTGVVATSDEACRIAREAGRAGVAAFVIRSRETDLPQLRRASTESGISLLVLPAAMRWEQITVLMRQAVAVPSSSGAGATTGNLFGFADMLAAAVGGAVTIEDAASQLLAYSTLHEEDLDTPRREAILGRRVPEAWVRYLRRTGVLQTLETSDEVVALRADEQLGLRRRLVVAVRAQGELLGSIWVQEGRLPLGEEAEAALRQGARLASAHLLHAHSTGLTVRHRREQALRGLLQGDTDVTAAADLLGFDAALPCAVLGIALDATGREGTGLQRFRRVDDLLRARATAFRWLVAGVVSENRLLVLLPELIGPFDEIEARVGRFAASVCGDAERAGISVRIACGPIAHQLALAAASTTAVDHMLQLLAHEPGRGRVATHTSARAAVAISRALTVLAPVAELTEGPVAQLLAHDGRHGTEYARTLAVWLNHLGDHGLAAHQLGIHPNTVRYRLQRIAQVSGLPLADPDERLVATLHLRLVAGEAVRGGAPSAPSDPA